MKRRKILISGGILLLILVGFFGWDEYMSRKSTIIVPVLQQGERKITGVRARDRQSIAASLTAAILKVPRQIAWKPAGEMIMTFLAGSSEIFYEPTAPGDLIHFLCPAGTNTSVQQAVEGYQKDIMVESSGSNVEEGWIYAYDPEGDDITCANKKVLEAGFSGLANLDLSLCFDPAVAPAGVAGTWGGNMKDPNYSDLNNDNFNIIGSPSRYASSMSIFSASHVASQNPLKRMLFCSARCGDFNVLSPEQCDEGAVATATCDADCTLPVCGDGVLNTLAGEQCDDGNTTKGDGCSDTCQITTQCNDGVDNADPEDTLIDAADPGCHTDGNASNTNSYNPNDNDESNSAGCGNGVREGTEQCDDGNVANGDGCDSLCRNEVCGNSIVQSGEQCDDGNTSNTDLCKNNCQFNVCGDGYFMDDLSGDGLLDQYDVGNALVCNDTGNPCTNDASCGANNKCINNVHASAQTCSSTSANPNVSCTNNSACGPDPANDQCGKHRAVTGGATSSVTTNCKLQPGWGCSIIDRFSSGVRESTGDCGFGAPSQGGGIGTGGGGI